MRKGAPWSVDVPSAERDTPGWIKVGIIAVIGFAVGVAWPRVMGVRLAPNPPGETASTSNRGASPSQPAASPAAVAKAAKPAQVAPVAAPVAPAAVDAKAAAVAVSSPAVSAPADVRVPRGAVLSCRSSEGENLKGARACGAVPALDTYLASRVARVATCVAADGSGKLSIVVGADFASNKITWELGKSTTVRPLEGARRCLDEAFRGASAKGLAHEQERYTVAYLTTVGEGTSSPAQASGGSSTARAADESVIRTENATVRDAPRTGQIIAQLPRGTTVKVGAVKDGWYPVKFGSGLAREGFIHRSAFATP